MSKASSPTVPKSELISLYRQALVNGQPVQEIEKKIQRLVTRQSVSARMEKKDDTAVLRALQKQVPWYVRWGAMLVPFCLLVVGIGLIGNAAVPILNAYLQGRDTRELSSLLTPVPSTELLEVNPLIIGLARADVASGTPRRVIEPVMLHNELDYTDLSNWFVGNQDALSTLQHVTVSTENSEETYTLEIPKLKVSNAKVVIGGTDLNSSLIQYPGTANPGEKGAPVIFGHSVLRQFYNPSEKNPRRYTSLFSTIMTLQKGDEIILIQDGVKYTYIVQEKLEVKPEDTYILNQRYDSSQLKLVTCVPEGTYLRRGIVVASLLQN